ncbi:MAG: PSD1 and planctomycete cytochrome C domain-containing protein [Fuerstiella sp.]|nr:PSD1 and planctomycete cytochrome C domain-containing protein [Fuerstiella sp.]
MRRANNVPTNMEILFGRLLVGLWAVTATVSAEQQPVTAEQQAFVQNKVIPLLEARCFECHDGTTKPKGGLILSNRELLLKGGDSGPSIVPGKPNESLLMEAVRYEGLEMPPRSKMPEAEIRILTKWVQMGAPWPEGLQDSQMPTEPSVAFPLKERRDAHWSWQPIQNPQPPNVRNSTWPTDTIDRFVLARLEEADMSMAQDADRQTLIRRLYFDIIGLIPTPEDIRQFADDPADDLTATTTVVDRLLASPRFGERWARHWLDLVRYAETLGHEFDYPLHHAWQYRDYVIRAFNADVPWNDFMREHVAGDLLSEPRRHPVESYNESLIGTGFWYLHEAKHSPVDVEYEEAVKIDNQIDVFGRAFMGLTVACARCHDHKFDAISTRDYYALYGILQSSRRRTGWLDPGNRIGRTTAQLSKLRTQVDTLVAQLQEQDLNSGIALRYANAALDVFRGRPRPGEQPFTEVSGARREIAAVADESSCHPDLLQLWVEKLGHSESQTLSDPVSLLARLAQSPPQDNIRSVVQQWLNEVRQVLNTESAVESAVERYADFSNGLPDGWSVTGPAFAGSKRANVAAGMNQHRVGHAGFSSGDLSNQFGGHLYSPTFEITHPEILIRVAGEGARVRLVIEGYVMSHFNKLLFSGIDQKINSGTEFQWIRIAGDTHRYIGNQAYLEVIDEGEGWFVIDEVHFVKHQNGAPPAVDLPMPARQLFQALQIDPQTDPVAGAVTFAWPDIFAQGMLPTSSDEQWTQLRTAWSEQSTNANRAVPVLAVTDGTGEDQYIFTRGNHRNPGPVALRSFLEAIAGPDQPPIVSGSGRRELAQRLLAEDNPFPARVAVNRIWHHLFGRGIVTSTDDFGVLGERPSHPDLLDHLAARFRKNGWSAKQLIRLIVLSRTYRMSSIGSVADAEKDPTNRLLHRARVRRLQGEVIRDTMLQLAERLNLKQFGTSVPIALTDFMQGRGRPKGGPLDGDGRRSVYISVNRNFLSPFMLAFDTPVPMSARGRRAVSNVPAQALIMLNDEFAHQQASRWAESLIAHSQTVNDAIIAAWQQALGRMPAKQELAAVQNFAQTQAKQYTEVLSETTIGHKTMQDVCHAIMNTKEFIYIR